MAKSPKILLYDVETSPIIAATFSLYPNSINHENILQDWFMICAAWKWLDRPTVYATSILDDKKAFSLDPSNDLCVIQKLRDVIAEADIVIGHNSDKFDNKKLNARLIHHNLEPIPKYHSVDTLKEIKKIAQFTSHRLDFLGSSLVGVGKVETSKGLWMRVIKGDKSAVKEMIEYNKGDVTLLESLYKRLLPYMKSHPHIGAITGYDRHETCPKCGSDHLVNEKIRYTVAGIKRIQKQCKSCGSYSTFTEYKVK